MHDVQNAFEPGNLVGLGSPLLHITGYETVCLFVLPRYCFLLLFASHNAVLPLGGKNCDQLMERELLEVNTKVSHSIDRDIL